MHVVDPEASRSKGPLPTGRAAIATRWVNVLVQGSRSFVADTLADLRTDCPHPEFTWPDLSGCGSTQWATLLVPDIDALPSHGHDTLAGVISDWYPRVRVIVTSSIALYELVERKQFPADLYYRLNIVVLTDDWRAPHRPTDH